VPRKNRRSKPRILKKPQRCEIPKSRPRDKWERIANGRREKGEEREVVVTGEDIIHIVSKWTGVPLNRMEQKEARKLLKMEEKLRGLW